MKLCKPSLDLMPGYRDALERGWSPDNLRAEAAQEELVKLSENAAGFVSSLDDPEARAGHVTLPDGSRVERLPSIRRWIWNAGFCGQIGFRWSRGTEDLPPTCSGHIGYAVVPWRRGEGMASAALVGILPKAKAVGLRYVTLTASPDNPASVRVIEKAGGVLMKSYTAPMALGGHATLEFQISLVG